MIWLRRSKKEKSGVVFDLTQTQQTPQSQARPTTRSETFSSTNPEITIVENDPKKRKSEIDREYNNVPVDAFASEYVNVGKFPTQQQPPQKQPITIHSEILPPKISENEEKYGNLPPGWTGNQGNSSQAQLEQLVPRPTSKKPEEEYGALPSKEENENKRKSQHVKFPKPIQDQEYGVFPSTDAANEKKRKSQHVSYSTQQLENERSNQRKSEDENIQTAEFAQKLYQIQQEQLKQQNQTKRNSEIVYPMSTQPNSQNLHDFVPPPSSRDKIEHKYDNFPSDQL